MSTTATTTTTVWELPESYQIDNDFFRPQERKQLQNAYRNFLMNTKYYSSNSNDNSDDEENAQMLLQSKIQLFQLFIRTQPVNIRSFSQYHQQYERVFVERLFYLILNNVELTHFSTFNIHSIISISKELEKYQRSTNKIILNTGKLNTIVQFVLSFSSSTVAIFQINNLFYLLLNDMNDFSGKIIDRVAELLRTYHSMTYGHAITKQSLISTIDHAISTLNYANPTTYPLYENFFNTSHVYKGPFIIASLSNPSKITSRISLYTIIQNLAIVLLGLTIDDFEYEDQFLSITSEQCYHIRLTIRRLTYIFKKYNYQIDYPLDHIDKQIVIFLIKSIIVHERTYNTLRRLLDLYMISVHGFSQTKIKRLLYDLLANSSFELYSIETIRYFIELNRLNEDNDNDNESDTISVLTHEDDLWLNDEQIRLVTHKLYSNKIYYEIFIPLINGDCHEEQTIEHILIYLDNIHLEQEQIIDVQDMKNKLTIVP
ncbi:unnamed protein product [Adineta steineri]|uniref:Uncharacterized protein n=2 Tax=Adineta steineri TaxID=433720 RepID=A0A815PL20_9BILA|nr:unnamed protein product [Adineta steineri]CAF1334124.1 unnamed protein product [Adineta steineri]CAF1450465.1 unnamed protein product [Adineta steineri]CAF1630345.1 unnamed protein product [Adineta steineri]